MLHPKDPRITSHEATEARRKEINNLAKRGMWKLVLESEVLPDANILTGIFIISIKDTETNNSYYKARYLVDGNQKKEKMQSCITRPQPDKAQLSWSQPLPHYWTKDMDQDISQA